MTLLSLVYFALAFGEILVLLASAIAVLVLILREIVAAINGLMDKAIDVGSAGTEPRAKSPSPFKIAAGNRLRRIPGGHNETF
jgi:hypothetical protein